jgi:hypothetical protein
MEMVVESAADPDVAGVLKMNAGKDYATVQGLPPGMYTIRSVVFQYQDSNRPQELAAPDGAVALRAGSVTVAPWQAAYIIEDHSRGNKMAIGVRMLPDDHRAHLLQTLAQEPEWEMWDHPRE